VAMRGPEVFPRMAADLHSANPLSFTKRPLIEKCQKPLFCTELPITRKEETPVCLFGDALSVL